MRANDSPSGRVAEPRGRIAAPKQNVATNETVSRTTITSAQLYAILDREFAALRPTACKSCRVPVPYWRQAPDDVSANWHIAQPRQCTHGCHLVIAEMLARMWTRYDIEKGYAH